MMQNSLVGVRIRTREETLRRGTFPLGTVLWAWSGGIALLIASASVWSIRHGGGDWRVFVAAGSLAGTPALLDPPQAWQSFFYLPGAAWALTPFARMPLAASFALDAALMLACAAAAGVVAARTYGLSLATGAATFALWSPVVYAAAIIGQNAPLGLFLAQLAIAGVATRSVALTAVPIGLLLYKPTYAVPFVALLVVRSRLRELAIVGAIGAGWYAAGVAATGGTWDWPSAWLRLIARYAAGDFAVNAPFAVSLPGVLVHAGAGAATVAGTTVVAAVCCAIALRRAGGAEAASAACLAGVALSPHAWAYDAVLALPMIAYTAGRFEGPARLRLLLVTALVGPLFFLSPWLQFDPLALLVVGGTLAWLVHRGWAARPAAL
jgi:hypothetical protein